MEPRPPWKPLAGASTPDAGAAADAWVESLARAFPDLEPALLDALRRQAAACLGTCHQLMSLVTSLESGMRAGTEPGVALAEALEALREALLGEADGTDQVQALAPGWLQLLEPAPAGTAGPDQGRVHAQAAYAGQLRRSIAGALERLSTRLGSMEAQGESITTLRELFDLWVECAEEAHREVISAPHHGRIVGTMVNSLVAGWRAAGTGPGTGDAADPPES